MASFLRRFLRRAMTMNATEKGRRSDALYYDTTVTNRRSLCDMIVNLESDLEIANAENAKLREQGADMDERHAKTFEVGKRWMAKAARFESENTKLRELVRELWTYAEQELLCDENCSYGAVCDWRDCVFERRMRELGVEVD